MDTVLFVPQVGHGRLGVAVEPPPKPEPKKAKIVEETSCDDASVEGRVELKHVDLRPPESSKDPEARLESVGNFLFAVGIIGGIVGLIGALASAEDHAATAGILFAGGVVAVVQGYVARVVFRGGATVIRLLKALALGKYSGKITQFSVRHSYKCSLCNAAAQPAQVRCSRCGAEFSRET